MNRFVRPDDITLTLTHGDTITIRRELTNGERFDQIRRGSYYVKEDKEWVRDPLLLGMSLVTAYLVDWTFRGEGDRVVPIKGLGLEELADVLHAISHDAFMEILTAIQAHEAALAREQQSPEALPPSDPISTSRGGAAGGMTGSAT